MVKFIDWKKPKIRMNPIVLKEQVFRWNFEEIEKWDGVLRKSDSFEMGALKWKIGISRNGSNLFVHTFLDSCKIENSGWICEINGTPRILERDGIEKGFKICSQEEFCFFVDRVSTDSSDLHWKIEKTLKENSILLETVMNIKFYDFSTRCAKFTNISFNVENVVFYFNKDLLCSHSTYFFNKFYEENSEDTEILLDDMKYQEFAHFLATICPVSVELTEETCNFLMPMAEKFGVESLHLKCERFLVDKSKLGIMEKLKLAEKYGYDELMNKCVDKFTTAAELKKFTQEKEFEKFENLTKLQVLRGFLRFKYDC